jgi:hypothetical protein
LRRWWDGAPALSPAEAAALRALDRQGARALLAGDVDAAVATWQRCVAQAPAGLPRTPAAGPPHAAAPRGRAPFRAARHSGRGGGGPHAQRPPARGRAALRRRAADRHRAAAAPPPTAGFHRAVVAMIAVDLSRVPGITVPEREKTELRAQELRLGATGLVDPARAARAGRMLSAGTVVRGSERADGVG